MANQRTDTEIINWIEQQSTLVIVYYEFHEWIVKLYNERRHGSDVFRSRCFREAIGTAMSRDSQ